MGREIRRVPPHHEHPQSATPRNGEQYTPTYNVYFEDKYAEYLADFYRIKSGNLSEDERGYWPNGFLDWIKEDGTPPDLSAYRTYKDEEATWFQMYETVTEGTPVTPPFETKEELINHLSTVGEFGDKPWDRGVAERFVEAGWAPTMMIIGKQILMPRDGGF